MLVSDYVITHHMSDNGCIVYEIDYLPVNILMDELDKMKPVINKDFEVPEIQNLAEFITDSDILGIYWITDSNTDKYDMINAHRWSMQNHLTQSVDKICKFQIEYDDEIYEFPEDKLEKYNKYKDKYDKYKN